MSSAVVVLLLGACLASAIVTRAARDVSRRLSLLDRPTERSSHTLPTPRIGGLGPAVGGTVGLLLLPAVGAVPLESWPWAYLLVGTAVVALVGLSDDLRSHSPLVKFTGQLVAVAPVAAALPGLHPLAGNPLAVALMAVWILGYTNLFNFMDGSDGLAGGMALINGLALAVLTPAGLAVGAAPALIVAAVALGFLRYNYPPASVFMGDVGSHFLGFWFGTAAVVLAGAGVPEVTLVMVFVPFLFDGAFTLIRRALRGERVWQAHRSHLYQRLLIAGWTHRAVAWLYYAWAVLGAGCAWLSLRGPDALAVAVAVVTGSALGVLLLVRREERAVRPAGVV